MLVHKVMVHHLFSRLMSVDPSAFYTAQRYACDNVA